MDAPGAQQHSGGNENDNQNHPQVKKNLSGLKHALHGTSYQLKLGIVVTLANAKKSKCPANNFTFTVTAEGRDESKTQNRKENFTLDKFDDIIYDFTHGSITGNLKIQAKHKQESSNLKITLNDLIAVYKNDFCIEQYYKSFCDQPQAKTKNDVKGFIICTNADLDDDAKVLWKPVDAAVLGNSTTSLDPYISSLFNETRGKCYQLKTHYKHAAFARLLINAMKSDKQHVFISWKTPLFKEYRKFIMKIIVKKDNGVWKFKDSFFYSSNNISDPGYTTFRNEFEDQYRSINIKKIPTGYSVWKYLEKNNEIHVSEDCLFDQNSEKSTMLAWLLVKAITSKEEKVSWQNPLFKEYRAAIVDVIDKNNYTTEDDYLLCKFNDKFLDGTSNDSILNYNTFRMDFEDQYRKAFNFDGTVWEDLKNRNQIYVAESFLNDKKKQNITSSTKIVEFPKNITEFVDDKMDESLNEIFCDRFRLVCGTYNQEELEIAIAKKWKMLHAGDGHMITGCLDAELASKWLFKTNFDWLMNPFAKPLHSEDIIKDFDNINATLAHMKLEPISDKLRKNVWGSPFRISEDIFKESKLYKQVETESLLQIETFDIQFGVTLLSDILESQGHTIKLFLKYSDFIHKSDTVEAVFRGKTHYCLVIICREYEAFKKVLGIVRKWFSIPYPNHKEDIPKNPAKHVFLIRKTSDIPSDLSCFRLSDLKKESRDQFCKKSISLCGTVISPCKIFQSSFTDLQIEEIIKLLDWGKQMNKNNQILKNFEKIKDIYVHRRMTLCSYGKKNGEYHSTRTDTPKVTDIQKAKSNLSGLKYALYALAYRLKLGIVVSLANAKKSLDPANDFSFEVAVEDPSAGKFDDIVYTFKDGGKAGILKIQVKYKLGSPAPKITVKDFTTNSDTKNPFAILKYFTSFCDQQQSTTDLEGFVICTNADINDQAKNIWKIVEPAITNDSAPSLDSYVSSLFDSIGAQYYQLKYYKLWAADGTYSNLYQLLRKCSKRARLAKLLIEAIKSNKKITSEIALFKEYRQAILQTHPTTTQCQDMKHLDKSSKINTEKNSRLMDVYGMT
ncbi:uncharacterized protein LOC125955384 [Anopheles darlingi]|uniref:uncharacterized protein LOC125955384 n=1 Tax=Anopheles darlingi TaxID=43151 RepID=UPI0021001163|nr:uncharacterized protein LOC125955384 [Anopheles darlingi]